MNNNQETTVDIVAEIIVAIAILCVFVRIIRSWMLIP